MLRLPQLVVVIFIFLGLSARASDISAEYQGLSETDLLGFEKPESVDSEYQTVWNAYLPPIDFARDWRTNSAIFQFSLGSLSNKYFFLYSRAKMETDLTSALRFRFTYLSQRDFEIDQVRHVLDLIHSLSNHWDLAVYGEPSLYKRENDLGAALIYAREAAPNASTTQRFFYTRHDFTRADHNNLKDQFVAKHNPDSVGWIGQWQTPTVWMEAGVRSDAPTIWSRPQEDRLFTFEKKLAYMDLKKNLSTASALALRLQWDRQRKGQSPLTPSSPITPEEWTLERTFVQAAFHRGAPDEKVRHVPALTYVTRDWRDIKGAQVKHQNIQPSYTVLWRAARRAQGFDYLETGIEGTSFHKEDPTQITSPTQSNSPFEGRLHTGYEWALLHGAKLSVGLNFDLDEWRGTPTFEGGSGQFQAVW